MKLLKILILVSIILNCGNYKRDRCKESKKDEIEYQCSFIPVSNFINPDLEEDFKNQINNSCIRALISYKTCKDIPDI